MKILLDMNLSPKLADMLVKKGIEAKHWFKIGAPNATDTEIMTHACQKNYVVVTNDLDFSAILSATQGQKPSVVQLRTGSCSLEKIAELLVFALQLYEQALDNGAILTIDSKKSRFRLLLLNTDTEQEQS